MNGGQLLFIVLDYVQNAECIKSLLKSPLCCIVVRTITVDGSVQYRFVLSRLYTTYLILYSLYSTGVQFSKASDAHVSVCAVWAFVQYHLEFELEFLLSFSVIAEMK